MEKGKNLLSTVDFLIAVLKILPVNTRSPDPKELARYFALAQVGLEMVVPIGLGVGVDYYFGWSPWCVIVGTIVGFAGGLLHLISLANKNGADSPQPPDGK